MVGWLVDREARARAEMAESFVDEETAGIYVAEVSVLTSTADRAGNSTIGE